MFPSEWFVLFGCVLLLLWIFIIVFHNLFFHPLSSFPGPMLARSSLLWRFWSTLGGTFHRDLYKLHSTYGPAVRISPNELSFASLGSWKDIYGFPAHGQDPMLKSNFYKLLISGFDSGCIGCEQNPDEHRRMKASLSAAFSTKALLEQELIVNSVIDSFVERIGYEVKAKGHVDMAKWFEMMAFDLMGEMTFGESFHCIQKGERHSWIKLILDHLFFVTVADNLRRLAIFNVFAKYLAPLINIAQKEHIQFTREKVRCRLESKSPRKDFVTNLVGKVESGEISVEELCAHSSTLVIAGGETVASSMSGLLFCLLSPSSAKSYNILRQELRSTYSKYSDIDFMSIQKLPYLQAVIKEGLRTFSNGHPLPRICPGRRIDGIWVPAGTEVYTSPWPMNHSPEYFTRPLEFLPERWLDSSRQNSEFSADVLSASQPFQLGPRGCLGRNFAMMEIGLSLAKLVWKYDLELANPNYNWADHVKIHVLWWKPELAVRITDASGTLYTVGMSNECMI